MNFRDGLGSVTKNRKQFPGLGWVAALLGWCRHLNFHRAFDDEKHCEFTI
jgi:hypothetical protein